MSEVKFYLEKRKDAQGKIITKNVPVLLFFSYEGKRLQHFTGLRIDALKWDSEKMKVKANQDVTQRYNEILKRQKRWVEEIFDNSKALGESLTLEIFRERLREKSGLGDRPSGKNFRECFLEFIDEAKLMKKPNTVNTIRTCFNNLRAFSTATRTALDFEKVNGDFYKKFVDYCFNARKFKNSHTGGLIKNIKAFMNWATEKGYNKNMEYKKKAFKKLTEEPEIIFLTYEELMHLYNLKIKNVKLDRVRDLFCFGCFTGMRFSDVTALTRENIHEDKIIYRITKTDEQNTIPNNGYIRRILNKYQNNDQPLPVVSKVLVNKRLKKLGELAKLNRRIKLTHFRGGERIVTIKPLKELISFHVSKKTFMTTFLSRGGSLETAMAITGNKDYRIARRYYKVVDSLKAREMQQVFGK